MTASGTGTLVAALWPESEGSLVRNIGLAFAGSLALWLSAKVQVPFWPIPMTMQTFVVLVLGAALGPRYGALAVLMYLAQGAAGLPVFAGTPEKGLGLSYMIGPTGGYLVGFLVGAIVVGFLAERGFDRSMGMMFLAVGVGHAIILACGWAWLATLIGPGKAWIAGVAPFHAATLLKTALAALCVPAVWRSIEG
jgi:biotin transport system substrate-specific component